MIGSLHLDVDDDHPRRFGPTSRTNSVRFDETANPGHWSRSSLDFVPRSSSSLGGLGGGGGGGGHPLLERSSSHKSDGKHSSAAQSITSGRLNSLGAGQDYGMSSSVQSLSDPPGLAPGLFVLGSVPAIIRCWLDTNFKHDALLYAAVCTGSYKSFLDQRLVEALGFSNRITEGKDGLPRISLPVYLPEAIPHPASSRPNSPAPALPSLTVEFSIAVQSSDPEAAKAIQVFLGSDLLRAHNADILFSSNNITLFDDDSSKLSIPLVRPENDASFKSLCVASMSLERKPRRKDATFDSHLDSTIAEANSAGGDDRQQSPAVDSETGSASEAPSSVSDKQATNKPTNDVASSRSSVAEHQTRKPVPPQPTAKSESREIAEQLPTTNITTAPARPTPPTAIWSNWRRDSVSTQPNGIQTSAQMDWPSASRGASTSYTRPSREQGIKVLKPARQSSARPTTTTLPASPGPGGASQSRFFDEGRRKSSAFGDAGADAAAAAAVGPTPKPDKPSAGTTEAKENGKPRSSNPLGGASAFAWMNSAQK